MSIYRTLDEGPLSEFSTQQVALKRKGADAPGGSRSPADYAHKRRAAPISEPLPVTFRWIARLPREVQPLALLQQFPRVANALASSWPDREGFRTCLYGLLIDRRGNRKGFPQEIVAELLALRAWVEQRHSLAGTPHRR
ncbi:MAG TPA: hypothetical protein VGI14_11485 [Casimicrobiaceae bacterium]|jgi:hypothetical protein